MSSPILRSSTTPRASKLAASGKIKAAIAGTSQPLSSPVSSPVSTKKRTVPAKQTPAKAAVKKIDVADEPEEDAKPVKAAAAAAAPSSSPAKEHKTAAASSSTASAPATPQSAKKSAAPEKGIQEVTVAVEAENDKTSLITSIPLPIVVAFVLAVLAVILYAIFQSISADPAAFGLIFPKSETIFDLEFWKRWYNWLTLDNLKKLAAFVQSIVDKQLPEVVIAFVLTYISMNAFMIPGSTNLNIIGGAVFGFPLAVLLTTMCTAIGATCCYFVSKTYLSGLVEKYATQIQPFRDQVKRNHDDLFSYILFLRVSPVPNWLINLSSPHIGVPLKTFALASFVGAIPLAAVHVYAGTAIHKLDSFNDIKLIMDEWPYINTTIVTVTGIASVLFLAPILIRARFADRFGSH